jgi:hypothetical protein
VFDKLPFNAFCTDIFATAAGLPVAVTAWAERIGCREPDLINWCGGFTTPSADDLLRIHRAVMDGQDLGEGIRTRWCHILTLPVRAAMFVPRYIRLPGDSDEGQDATVGDCLLAEMLDALSRTLLPLPMHARIDYLHACEAVAHFSASWDPCQDESDDGASQAARVPKKPLKVL